MAEEDAAALLTARLIVRDDAENQALLARRRTWRESMEVLDEVRAKLKTPLFELDLEEEKWPKR